MACVIPMRSAQAALPGSALRFDGVNGYVVVTNNPSLNAYPFTATAWFRTTNSVIVLQGLMSKYVNASGDGWALIVQNGHLRGFFYRGGGIGNKAIDATSAASVADGFWHQAALVVDGSGGKLYVDGIQAGASSWTGSAGAPASPAPLQIGRYDTIPDRFQGDIDEATIWNRGLGVGELNYLKHRQLNGNEDGLVALWHFDVGSGDSTADATGHGFTGALISSPQWVTSTAPLVFSSVAGSGLKFDGVNQQVLVTNTTGLNTLPFTMMAWVRTSQSNTAYPAILAQVRRPNDRCATRLHRQFFGVGTPAG